MKWFHAVGSSNLRPGVVAIWARLYLAQAAEVEWEVSRHRNFRTWVSHGIVIATQANDYRVSVEVDELHEGTRYFYRFKTSGEYSPQADFRF